MTGSCLCLLKINVCACSCILLLHCCRWLVLSSAQFLKAFLLAGQKLRPVKYSSELATKTSPLVPVNFAQILVLVLRLDF